MVCEEVDDSLWLEAKAEIGPPMRGHMGLSGRHPITASWSTVVTADALKATVDDIEAAHAGVAFKADIVWFDDDEHRLEGIAANLSSRLPAASGMTRVDVVSERGEVVVWAACREPDAADDDTIGICFDEALASLARPVVLRAFKATTGHDGEAMLDEILVTIRKHLSPDVRPS